MHVEVKPHPKFLGVYTVILEDGLKRLATRNLVPRRAVYGEKLVRHKGEEYRLWDAFRSKLAAAILKNISHVPIKPGNKVLYLGAASGTTASHVSDIVGEEGHVYCVEFASRAIRELVNNVCVYRPNMSPLLEDARFPERYTMFVSEVNVIYCDVAQPEQAKILADNADHFLKPDGWIMLAIKAQSIDVTRNPSEIYQQEISVLKSRGFQIRDMVHLEPYDKAHALIIANKK